MKKILSVFLTVIMLLQLVPAFAVEEDVTVTSAVSSLPGVPVEASIPLTFSSEVNLSADEITVRAGTAKIKGFELKGSGTEYTLDFTDNMYYGAEYSIDTPYGLISYTTAYDTVAADIKDGISDTDNQAIKAISFGRDLTELTLKLDFSTFSGTGYFRLYNNLTDKKRIAALTLALSNGNITLNHWQYDVNGKNGKESSLISQISTEYTIYITYKDGYVYPFAVSADGDVKYGNKKEYPTGTAFGAMATTNSKINAWAGDTVYEIGAKSPESITLDDFVADSSSDMILYPHFGTPVFTEPGGSFTAEIASTVTTLSPEGWLVYAENEYKAWNCTVEATEYTEDSVYLGTRDGYKLNVTLPENISPELMNLVVKHEDSTLCYRSPQSVSIVPDLNADFYAMAVSDTHINAWKKEYATVQEGRNVETMNKALELGGARYLYHGGDIGGYVTIDKISAIKDIFVDAFTTSKIPLIVVPGNHEYDPYSYPSGGHVWNPDLEVIDWSEVTEDTDLTGKQVKSNFNFDAFDRMFGMRSALIPMGDSMLIAKHDYGGYWNLTGRGNEEELTEPFILRNALADAWQSWNNGNENAYRIIYQHTWNTGARPLDLTNDSKQGTYGAAAFMSPTFHTDAVNLIPYDFQAVGHYHSLYPVDDKVLCFGGAGDGECDWAGEGILMSYDYDASLDKKWALDTTEIMTADPYKGIQYVTGDMTSEYKEERDKYIEENYHTDFIIDGHLEQPALYASYYNPNNGSAEYNIATVTNKLDFNFYDGRVKFIMKKGAYKVENAELLSQYDSHDGAYTVVLAKVNIPEAAEGTSSEISVSCVPVSTSADVSYNLEGAETGFVSADTAYLNLVSTADIPSDSLTKEDVIVTKNGALTEYELSFPGSRTCRIDFTGGLSPQSKYTVTVGSQKFVFVTLPDEYIENEYYKTGALTQGSQPISFADMPYENFVMDVTLRNVTPGNLERTPTSNTYGRINFNLYPTVEDTTYTYQFYAINAHNPTTFRQWHMLSSATPSGNKIGDGFIANRKVADVTSVLTTTPLEKLEDEESYDFRIIKVGKTLSLYAKNTRDRSYDRLFEYHDTGAADGYEYFYLPEGKAYAKIGISGGNVTNSAAKGLRLYEIKDEADIVSTNLDSSTDAFNVTSEINCSYIDLSDVVVGSAICASYQGDSLIDVDVQELRGGLNTVTFEPLLKGDKCSLFVFGSLTNVTPLVQKKVLYGENTSN